MKKIYLLLFFATVISNAQYTGTASVTQGLATTTNSGIYTCSGGRISALGTITATNNTVWTVPAVTNFSNTSFPFASDLHNPCNGNTYANSTTALAALSGSDIVTVDSGGEVFTAYIFADNYFEMYVNGVAVGKDNVPFTQFNSNIVRFKVNRPFTIAMHLVDWEERLGLGGETSGSFNYHCGDGGMVAVIKDASGNIVAKTGSDWKAQTFYSAPIKDLTCPTETGTLRSTANCDTSDSTNGTSYYALHWTKPTNWNLASFDDSSWQNAYTYSNATVGVNGKSAYTNFTNIFDDATNDASFIWSSNLILDNEVVVRKTINSLSTETNSLQKNIKVYPNPTSKYLNIELPQNTENRIESIEMYNLLGKKIKSFQKNTTIDVSSFSKGIYILKIKGTDFDVQKEIIIE